MPFPNFLPCTYLRIWMHCPECRGSVLAFVRERTTDEEGLSARAVFKNGEIVYQSNGTNYVHPISRCRDCMRRPTWDEVVNFLELNPNMYDHANLDLDPYLIETEDMTLGLDLADLLADG